MTALVILLFALELQTLKGIESDVGCGFSVVVVLGLRGGLVEVDVEAAKFVDVFEKAMFCHFLFECVFVSFY